MTSSRWRFSKESLTISVKIAVHPYSACTILYFIPGDGMSSRCRRIYRVKRLFVETGLRKRIMLLKGKIDGHSESERGSIVFMLENVQQRQ